MTVSDVSAPHPPSSPEKTTDPGQQGETSKEDASARETAVPPQRAESPSFFGLPDESPRDPDESHKERVDRELGELLQGLRVSATGVQVLFAFLLTLPFASGFDKVDETGRWLFYVAMLSAAVASICFIAPATQHRILFRSALKELMLHRANLLGVVGGLSLAVSLTCSTGLVVEAFLGVLPAVLLAGAVAFLSCWLWFLLPMISRYRQRKRVANGEAG
ncbi:hypothetical protein Sru01_16150 [Sphaerisporangium rufum]|uniref:Uncharacterized protein n=1 Tax=Sphaerisporangium rufum TaxID=1381558 RepID=A0A919V0F3_9ACTN|nr:DUF6328 family protein [Sphaerisporangium rufum]GII76633.1 hypothetical protein Sru01_16150 [Sphaerisporangium rufum]